MKPKSHSNSEKMLSETRSRGNTSLGTVGQGSDEELVERAQQQALSVVQLPGDVMILDIIEKRRRTFRFFTKNVCLMRGKCYILRIRSVITSNRVLVIIPKCTHFIMYQCLQKLVKRPFRYCIICQATTIVFPEPQQRCGANVYVAVRLALLALLLPDLRYFYGRFESYGNTLKHDIACRPLWSFSTNSPFTAITTTLNYSTFYYAHYQTIWVAFRRDNEVKAIM